MIVFETKRLLLREMTQNDFNDLCEVFCDKDLMCYYPYEFDENKVKYWIDYNIKRYEIFGIGLWSVVLKETGEVIGDCGITMQNIDGFICPEIGYHIKRKYQRCGYAKEAAGNCRDWVFDNTIFLKVFSYMRKDNIPSRKTAESIGMKFLKEYKDDEGNSIVVYMCEKC